MTLIRRLLAGLLLASILLGGLSCRNDQGVIDRHRQTVDEEED